MKKAEYVLASLIVLLGLRFGLVAAREFTAEGRPWPTAFYLSNTCLFFVLCGALNMLRIQYGAAAAGVKVVSVATNLGLAALVLTAGIIASEAAPSAVVAIVLVAAAALGLRVANRA